MNWNYRVCKKVDDIGDVLFEVHEAYYNNAGELCAMTNEAVAPIGETLEELADDIKKMLAAFDAPVLDVDTVTFASWGDEDDE